MTPTDLADLAPYLAVLFALYALVAMASGWLFYRRGKRAGYRRGFEAGRRTGFSGGEQSPGGVRAPSGVVSARPQSGPDNVVPFRQAHRRPIPDWMKDQGPRTGWGRSW